MIVLFISSEAAVQKQGKSNMILEASTERYRIVTVALGYILPTYLLRISFENHITFRTQNLLRSS